MRKLKRIISLFLVGVLYFSMTFNVYAAEENIEDIVQKAVDEGELEATVTKLAKQEYLEVWEEYFSNREETKKFSDKLLLDDFKEMEDMNNYAVKIVDNENDDLVMYYFFKFYENNIGEKVIAMLIASPNANSVFNIWSQKINVENEGEEYYSSINEFKPVARDFNTISFICSLSNITACSAYSYMLAAIPWVAILVGTVGCNLAFAYVCAHT